jgi:hypothetical protein
VELQAGRAHYRREVYSVNAVTRFSSPAVLAVSFIYSLLFVLFPWEYLLGFTFPDKLNYMKGFYDLQKYGFDLVNPLGTFLGAIISESLWSLILITFGYAGVAAEQALMFVSFFCLLLVANFLFSKTQPLFAAVFLLNPLVVDFVMAQQRSALAFSLFLLFLTARNSWMRFALAVTGSFIHLAFVLLLAGYWFAKRLTGVRILDANIWNRFSHLVIVFCLAVFILLSKELILAAMGDRRASGHEGSQSLMYASFWFLLICYVYVFSHSRETWVHGFSALFVSLFLVGVLLNTYSSRFLVFAYPFLLIVLFRLPRKEQLIGLFLLLIYQSIQWVFWWGWFTR